MHAVVPPQRRREKAGSKRRSHPSRPHIARPFGPPIPRPYPQD
jgi:hypothetical protein